MAIVLLVIYILLSIFLIKTLVRCFKNKEKWWKLFIYEILALALSAFLCIYFDNLPGSGFMPGLTYLGEVLISYGAIILFAVILAVTAISKTVIFLHDTKKQDRRRLSRIYLVVSGIICIFGIALVIEDLSNDIYVKKVEATIIGYVENEYGYERPIVQYRVDGETYEAMIEVFTMEIKNSGINDKVTIHYDKRDPSQLGYLSYYESLYIPLFLVSIILFIVAWRHRVLSR